MQNVTARKPDDALARAGRDRMRAALEAAHVERRIARPALPADVGIEAAVAVGDDVETRNLLLAQIGAERIDILLAIARADHRLEKCTRTEVLGVPAWPRQRADDGGGQHQARARALHGVHPCWSAVWRADHRMVLAGPTV